MTINYKIEQVKPNIFVVIVKDSYDRAMLFCRVQEFYESPNEDFRNKKFTIWDYIKWYSQKNGIGFTYALDWDGFNIPFDVLKQCYDGLNEFETPYDKVMSEIYNFISLTKSEGKAYILGIGEKNDTFKHELCHALWYTNEEYKKQAEEILNDIEPDHIQIFEKNLIAMGYTEKVWKDEIQAYLTTTWYVNKFYTGMTADDCQVYHQEFHKILNDYLD